MKDFKIILIAFLLGATAFSAARYAVSLREQRLLQVDLEAKNTAVNSLQGEKQNLLQAIEKEKELNRKTTQRNILLRENLRAGKERLRRLFAVYNRAEEDNERLNSQVAILKAENTAVRAETDKLKLELAAAAQENENLNNRMNSAAELKKALRDLKSRKNPPSVEIKKIEVKKKPIPEAELMGNRGYLIKDGLPCPGLPAVKVKIEVNPFKEPANPIEQK